MAKGIAHLGILLTLGIFAGNGHAVSIGDLLITEIMVNPKALPDSRGEWFELYNPTDQEVNLEGISIGDDNGGDHRFESDLLILPGEYLTLARSGDPGFIPDYVYDGFNLSNSGDEIVLRNGATELLRLDYDAGFDQAGQSRWLAGLPMLIDNFELSFAQLVYGYGDIGSPGSSGRIDPVVSTVSLPASVWLLVCGMLSLSLANMLRRLNRPTWRIPVTDKPRRCRRSSETGLALSQGNVLS
jgi:hypothetical protein